MSVIVISRGTFSARLVLLQALTMRFTRARSVSIIGGLVISGCGTILPTPDDTDAERSAEATEPASVELAPSAPSSTDVPSNAAPATADAGSDAAAAKKPNGEDCTDDTECASATCSIGGKSHYCTITCAEPNADDVAECMVLGAPFTGACSKEGFCKR